MYGFHEIAPSIVGVRNLKSTFIVIDRNDIAEDVFLVPEGFAKLILVIIMEAYRRTGRIVDKIHSVVFKDLGNQSSVLVTVYMVTFG